VSAKYGHFQVNFYITSIVSDSHRRANIAIFVCDFLINDDH